MRSLTSSENQMKHGLMPRKALSFILSMAVGIGLVTAGEGVYAGPDGRALMEKMAESRKLDGSEAVVKMKIYSASNQVRERKIKLATKLYDNGKTEKRVYKFLEPADVKGTGVLVFDYDKKADDMWIFLPALRKTRRVVSSEKSKSFMGSEFTYGDLNIPSLDDYTYKFLREEGAGGETCYLIEVVPANDSVKKEEGYSKKLLWLSKKSHAIRQGHFFGLDGKLAKVLTTRNVKQLDAAKDRWRPMYMEMVNKTNGRKSVFETEKVAVTPNTKDEYFTTRYIERP